MISKQKADKKKVYDANVSASEMAKLDKSKVKKLKNKNFNDGSTEGKIKVELPNRAVLYARNQTVMDNMIDSINQPKKY